MKTTIFCLAALVFGAAGAFTEEAKKEVVRASTISARDGFTRSGAGVLITRNGVTQRLEKEVTMTNGLRVGANGTVTLPNGEKASLENNQILTFDGNFESTPLTPQGTALGPSGGAPINKPAPAAGAKMPDGVLLIDGSVVVVRDGRPRPLTSELDLANGAKVQSDGRILYPDGTQGRVRKGQLLTFDGVFRDLESGK